MCSGALKAIIICIDCINVWCCKSTSFYIHVHLNSSLNVHYSLHNLTLYNCNHPCLVL